MDNQNLNNLNNQKIVNSKLANTNNQKIVNSKLTNTNNQKNVNSKSIKQSTQRNNDNQNKLSNLFKEIQDIRYGRAEAEVLETEKEEIKFNRIYVVDHKFNAVGAVIGVLFLILFTTLINSNHILAISEEEKVAIGEFEENKNAINIIDTMSANVATLTKKEIINKDVEIAYSTRYVETNLLPKDEQEKVQEGSNGVLEQTVIMNYENGELLSENVISEIVKTEPIEEIIEVGTSEYLAEKKVYVGDTMYTTKQIEFYSDENAEEIVCEIYESIDVTLISEEDGIAKIIIDGMEGYVKSEFLTSEFVDPGSAEKARIKRLKLSVSEEMALNTPSSLNKNDFIKVLSENEGDRNKVFEENAEFFYEIEQNYNINGIFLAAIGIHESNWGTSNISVQKKNLFGYGSFDSSSFESSYEFESYEDGIELLAKVLSKYYLNEQGTEIFNGEIAAGTYYNGPTVRGVNTRYASDTNWATRVYSIMVDLYEKL